MLFHCYGFSLNEFPFNFPTFEIHDDDYCDILNIDERKAIYLLTFKAKDDKSVF